MFGRGNYFIFPNARKKFVKKRKAKIKFHWNVNVYTNGEIVVKITRK